MELIQEGIWVIDTAEITVYVNAKMASMLGYTADEMMGAHLFSFISKEEMETVTQALARRKEGHSDQLEFIFTHKSGRRVYTRIGTAPIFTAERKYAGAVALVADISNEKQTGEALRRTEASLQAVVDNILDVFVQTDVEGKVLYISPSCRRVLGYAADLLTGQCSFGLMHPEDREKIRCMFNRLIEGGSVENPEFRLRRADGSYIWIETVGKALYDPAGKLDFAAFVLRDISERKRIEEEQLRAAKLESIGLLAGGIAHDFNNLLSVVIGNLSLAKLFLNKPFQLQERLEKSEKAALQAKELSSRLLAFSKGEITEKRSISVVRLIEDALSYAAARDTVNLIQEIPGDLSPLWVDSGQIAQVFGNIILNAVQVVPEGGMVRISAASCVISEEADSQVVSSLKPGPYVRVSISDNGPGIPPESLDKIFEPFFTTKEKGYGLGLATAYYLVKKHDGSITLESQPGRGTTFNIYLPVANL